MEVLIHSCYCDGIGSLWRLLQPLQGRCHHLNSVRGTMCYDVNRPSYILADDLCRNKMLSSLGMCVDLPGGPSAALTGGQDGIYSPYIYTVYGFLKRSSCYIAPRYFLCFAEVLKGYRDNGFEIDAIAS